MYSLDRQPFSPFTLVRLRHDPTGQFVTINPGFGGMLHQLGLSDGHTVTELLDTYHSPNALQTTFADTYRGAKLSPFANMVAGGRYTFGGTAYQLPINWPADGHAIHGFVADKPFDVVSEKSSDTGAELALHYSDAGQTPGFPFPFHLTVTYRLHAETGFSAQTTVENTGETPMPYADGWHPYFRLADSIDRLCLQLPTDTEIVLDNSYIPTGKTTHSTDFERFTPIGNRPFDACFRVKTTDGLARTYLRNPQTDTELCVWQQADAYPYVQIYSPPDRQSLAIEPMTAWPDALNNQQGLLRLAPGQRWTGAFGINLTASSKPQLP